MASSSLPYVAPSAASSAPPPPATHIIYASVASNREHVNPLQQRAAAAAQALLAPGRSISQREIQAMLEKNEAALKGWNALYKQQPAKTNPVEHKEWVRRCLTFRQQIGARLEVLASLADKQIAQEDEKGGTQRVSPNAAAARQAAVAQNSSLAAPNAAVTQVQQQQPSPAVPPQVFVPPQVSMIASSNPLAMTTSTSVSMVMPNMAAPTPPTMFPEPPMPTVGFASTSSSMFFSTGQMNPMQTSAGFSSTTSMAASGVTTSTQGYVTSSGVQTFTPNAYMTSTSGPPSSSAAFMNQQNYMMGGGMMTQQQQFMPMPMPMPMNLASSGGANMYGNDSYGMSANNNSGGNGNNNSSSNNFPVDPFMTPIGFPGTSFGSAGFPMANMPSMPMQQQQMMGSMNGGNFGAQGASMMPNNFGYGGMPTSSAPNVMPQSLPTQQFQPTPQPFQQQNQLPQHQPQQTGSMSMSPDSALYGDSNVNIFEGLTDDAFFPMQ